MRQFLAAAMLTITVIPSIARADDVKIDEIVTAGPADAKQTATLAAVKAFYQFWNDGDDAHLKAALSPAFTDRTLPPGRPQGPQGPSFASKHFRAAVPDLRVEVKKMIVAGDYVTVHMEFTGHFTGEFGHAKGSGQSIDFIATDLLRVTDGLVTDNWHIEDNLTLLTQMGVAKVEQ
jgi:predicted ester cyclase